MLQNDTGFSQMIGFFNQLRISPVKRQPRPAIMLKLLVLIPIRLIKAPYDVMERYKRYRERQASEALHNRDFKHNPSDTTHTHWLHSFIKVKRKRAPPT
jgi:hypothetical protein